jgi:hypothetical protein
VRQSGWPPESWEDTLSKRSNNEYDNRRLIVNDQGHVDITTAIAVADMSARTEAFLSSGVWPICQQIGHYMASVDWGSVPLFFF